ncbi:AAA family ATPase [bacterium]|nr:AAA family ATPase [bacterium]
MYEKYFGLNESPFNMTPDPKFLYFSDKHSECLTQLLYGIKGRKGFLVITGEIGAGKTTLCRALLNELDENIKSALILNSNLSEIELLQAINGDLGLPFNFNNKKELIDELNKFLLKELGENGNVVIIIDEAQNLTPSVLEQIRLLSNLETTKKKLLQIILFGQPQLRDILQLPELMQLNQRISIRYHINPLSRKETEDYINHRLVIAGSKGDITFSTGALNKLYKYSGGIPRLINVVCDKALLAGYVLETRNITKQIIDKSISEIEGTSTYKKKKQAPYESKKSTQKKKPLIAVSFVVAVFLLFIWMWTSHPPKFLTSLESKSPQTGSNKDTNSIDNINSKKEMESEKAWVNQPSKMPEENKENRALKFYFDDNEILRAHDPTFSGITSLFTLLKLWNIDVDPESEYEKWKDHTGYFSFWSETAKYGLQATFIRLDFKRLKALSIPCILQVQDTDLHNIKYLVFMGYKGDNLLLANCSDGLFEITEKGLEEIWNGVSILIWKNLSNLTRELKEGMTGEDVKKAEEIFRKLGYFKGIPPTDYFSAITSTVVKHFQTAIGIKVDGIIGPETKIALFSQLENSGYPTLIHN